MTQSLTQRLSQGEKKQVRLKMVIFSRARVVTAPKAGLRQNLNDTLAVKPAIVGTVSHIRG